MSGVVTAIVGELDLTQAWLVIGYVLLFIIVIAFAYHAPYDASSRTLPTRALTTDRPSNFGRSWKRREAG